MKEKIKLWLVKVRQFAFLFRAKPVLGGLEISDAAIRFAFWNGSNWETVGNKLAPGVMVGGKVVHKEEVISALRLLRAQILGPKKARGRKRVNVVVSLSSVRIYTQVFNLPILEGANLEKAIQINLQMSSPAEEGKTYAGWQVLESKNAKENVQLEVLSAFLERSVADDIAASLRETLFVPVVVEPGSLSLVRMLREAGDGFEPEYPVIVTIVNQSGITIIVVRHGHLHFNYFTSWGDLKRDATQLSLEEFRAAIIRNIYRVLNFYNAHWKEPLREILVSAEGMQEEVMRIIGANFEIPARGFSLRAPAASASSDWFTAMGAGLRGLISRRKDTEISLLGIDAQEEFRRAQIIVFTEFWRVLAPVTLSILLAAFITAGVFVGNINGKLEARVAALPPPPAELSVLEQEARDFNELVALMGAAGQGVVPKTDAAQALLAARSRHGVSIGRFVLSSGSTRSSLSGTASSESDILAFKDELGGNVLFQDIDLPITEIRREGNTYSFSLSFLITSRKTD